MATFTLTCIGEDRPGLVSDLSAPIRAHGASLEPQPDGPPGRQVRRHPAARRPRRAGRGTRLRIGRDWRGSVCR
ncbi:hypothetical protein G5V59_04035 [Nocardioides sp. W3-2-3]|uniref:hypothetical protein n=1 Tax=Nocardioides convexus TaxID=2712224 RepID=UPI00241867AD|nr:hypothetical protein [Nocardioides convexus]NGZ99787.1 hypothetical protein [Nocardioides convexus]